MSNGPPILDIPEREGGTPQDEVNMVVGQNRQAAVIYKAKHEGLKGCINEFNSR